MISGGGQQLSEFDCEEIAKTLTAAFRWHPHISNVLTHICGSQWTKIEAALRSIVDPATRWADLSPLSQNLVELMWAERGVTGRILKPYLWEFVARALSQRASGRLLRHLAHLCSMQETVPVQRGEEHPAETSSPIAEKAHAMNDPVENTSERVLDVREIEPRIRHTLIFQLFEHLDDSSCLQLVADHDPRQLRLQLEAKHGDRCYWAYFEQGPDVWRVRLRSRSVGSRS